MQYISLYTVPASKDSLNTFDDYGYYFFDDSENSKFILNKINESCYLGLGREYEINNLGLDYLKIQKVGKISKVGKFIINYDGESITNFTGDKSENINEAFNKHFDCFHRYNTGKIKNDTPKKWIYIYTEDNIIDLDENILYPSKDLVSIPLNLDLNGNYINSFKLIDSLKISENVLFNFNAKKLIVKGESIGINEVYGKIIDLLFKSKNKEFDIDNHKEEFKELKKSMSFDYDSLRTTTVKGFNDTLKKYLDFEIFIHSKTKIGYKKIVKD